MNTSYRIVELVRAKISNQHLTASDTDVSRVLGLSRAQVSAYKHSKSVMSPETLQLANKLLQLSPDDFDEILLALTIEGTREPELRSAWKRISRSAAALVALAMVAAGTIFAPAGNQASAASFDGPKYTLCALRKSEIQIDSGVGDATSEASVIDYPYCRAGCSR